MTGTILLLIMAASIGIYHDSNKPTKYELNMEDGSNTHVVLQKNNQYACPLNCGVEHYHHAVIYNNNEDAKNVYHISKPNDNGISLYNSTKIILSMTRQTPRIEKDKLPEVVSASKEN